VGCVRRWLDHVGTTGALLLAATSKAVALGRAVRGLASAMPAAVEADRAQRSARLSVSACSAWRLATRILNDHDELRHDPVMAVLAGKLEAAGRRRNCAPWAGKSTLNRLEHAPEEGAGLHLPAAITRSSHDAGAIERPVRERLFPGTRNAHATPTHHPRPRCDR